MDSSGCGPITIDNIPADIFGLILAVVNIEDILCLYLTFNKNIWSTMNISTVLNSLSHKYQMCKHDEFTNWMREYDQTHATKRTPRQLPLQDCICLAAKQANVEMHELYHSQFRDHYLLDEKEYIKCCAQGEDTGSIYNMCHTLYPNSYIYLVMNAIRYKRKIASWWLVVFLPSEQYNRYKIVLDCLIEADDVDYFEELRYQFFGYMDTGDFIARAFKLGKPNILKHLLDGLGETLDCPILSWKCVSQHTLIETIPLIPQHNGANTENILAGAFRANRIDIIEYMINKFALSVPTGVTYYIGLHGMVDYIDRVLNRNPDDMSNILEGALGSNNPIGLETCITRSYDLFEELLKVLSRTPPSSSPMT